MWWVRNRSAGKMNSWVRVRRPVTADDGQGGQIVTGWTSSNPIPAETLPIDARERAIAGGVQLDASYSLSVRYQSGIEPTYRLERLDPPGRELEILGVRDPDGRKRWLEVECKEVIT
jgi:SPP1 family predicted phage head-tail adaptor